MIFISKRFSVIRLLAAMALLLACQPGRAQRTPVNRYALASIFQAATSLPPGNPFSGPLHPGFTAGAEFGYNHNPKRHWFQTAKFGFSHHQYVQSTLQLYSEFGYRQGIWNGIAAELRLGAGYLHAIPAAEIFALKDGVYSEKKLPGRPQVMAGAALGLSYTQQKNAKPLRFFLDYQFYLQMPFVKQYVPLLPNTLWHAGVGVPFSVFQR